MYELVDVSKDSKRFPHAFMGKPSQEVIDKLEVGDLVLLGFKEKQERVLERKFVRITDGKPKMGFTGILDQNIFVGIDNDSLLTSVNEGDTVTFEDKHIWRIG